MNLMKVTVTCSLTGVLTDPENHPVPVTPEEMAADAKAAFDAGASVMHVHFRRQEPGLGHLPTWDPSIASEIVDAIRQACPGVILNNTTGVFGDDISGPLECLESTNPEMAAMNAGSLNYLRTRKNGAWAWPPMLFDNTVDKIEKFLSYMYENDIVPECECFDTGIVRSIGMFVRNGILKAPPYISLVMGVASGMPANPDWLPLLLKEMPEGAHWQTIGIGRAEVWDLHRRTAELGGHLRTGVEDTFYLPNGERTTGNGQLIEAMVSLARECGREIMSPDEVRAELATHGA
ncbi:MAG: hypothetical protein ACJAYU_002795 [Bradymonadia bacterium]|jgi:uncharacterized protein (DUF849 family)